MPAMINNNMLQRRLTDHKLIKIKPAQLAGIQSNDRLYHDFFSIRRPDINLCNTLEINV